MSRHALLKEMAEDVDARIKDLGIFEQTHVCQATRLKDVVEKVTHLVRFPAAIVLVGDGEYPDGEGFDFAQPDRFMCVTILIVGRWSAADDEDADDVWDLEDAVDRSFTPDDGEGPVTINGVEYRAQRTTAVDVGARRAARALRLEAIDTVQSRDDV